MSAMAEDYVRSARAALESLGALEGCVKCMSGATHEKLREASGILSPVLGMAAACIQSALGELEPDEDAMSAARSTQNDKEPRPQSPGAGAMNMSAEQAAEAQKPAAEVLQMSAADRDKLTLGAEVLKMTGAATSAEALGKLEGERASIDAMKAELIKMGAELGIPGMTGDSEKFKAYDPGRLLAYMSAAPRIKQNGAVSTESDKPARQHAEVDADVDSMLARTMGRHGIAYQGAK